MGLCRYLCSIIFVRNVPVRSKRVYHDKPNLILDYELLNVLKCGVIETAKLQIDVIEAFRS